MEIKREEVEIVKMSIRGLEYQEISAIKTLIGSIDLLYDYYKTDNDIGYLYSALHKIQAYLEMGFDYNAGKESFNRILNALGTTKEAQFPKRTYAAKEVPLTRPQIRRLIKPWSGSKYHTMSIEKVPDDIIDKVLNKKVGVYEYHSNAHPAGTEFDYVYILYVDEDESYLYNVKKGSYYLLASQEAGNENSDR